jgi:hypothetical protein
MVPQRLSTRSTTNILLLVICALLGLQLLTGRAVLGPDPLLAERALQGSDGPQPVYLVQRNGTPIDMLSVRLMYVDRKGILQDVVSDSDGSFLVRQAH